MGRSDPITLSYVQVVTHADIIRSAVLPILVWEKVPWEQGGRRLLANVLNFCLFYVSLNGVYIRPVSQIANMVKFSTFKS